MKRYGVWWVAILAMAWAGAAGADTLNLRLFAFTPPSGWRVESDGDHSIVASAEVRGQPPFMVMEACQRGGSAPCPSACDLPSIEASGFVPPLDGRPRSVPRTDDYREYVLLQTQYLRTGITFTAARLLCGPQGMVFAALVDTQSEEATDRELEAVIKSITWRKP